MKRLSFFFLMILVPAGFLPGQSLDDVLANHAKASGYDQLSSVKTTRMEGVTKRGAREVSFTILTQGDKIRYEGDMQGRKMIQIFNGTQGWFISPRTGEVQEMPARLVQMIKERAQLAGSLAAWKDIRDNLSLEGKEEMDGKPVYKISYTHAGGGVTHFFIDANDYLLLKSSTHLSYNGNDLNRLVTYEEYKNVEGVMIPFVRKIRTESGSGTARRSARTGRGGNRQTARGAGRGPDGGQQVIRFTGVEFNTPVDDSLFTKNSLTR